MPQNIQRHNHQKCQLCIMQQELLYTKDDRNTHLATHYQQLHTEGRGLNTLFSFRQTLQKNFISTIQLERDLTWAWSFYMDNAKAENHMPMILMN